MLSVTNTSVLDNSELIFSWDWSKPPANIFMVPMQLPCEHADGLLTKELIDAKDPFVRPMGLSCSACKLAVGKLIGMGCNAARAACALTGTIGAVKCWLLTTLMTLTIQALLLRTFRFPRLNIYLCVDMHINRSHSIFAYSQSLPFPKILWCYSPSYLQGRLHRCWML